MTSSASDCSLHWSLYPRHYVVPKTPQPLVIDGNIDKPDWDLAPFSAPFDDIRGPHDGPSNQRPPPSCTTRVKMMWDDDFLYIAALLHTNHDFPVVATFTQRNEPIFHRDSDFEVFLDPSASCYHYKELEINAINTVWNLMLDRPYADGGREHSGRIAPQGEEQYYDVCAQKSATRMLKGSISVPSNHSDDPWQEAGAAASWAVELAMAHTDTIAADPRAHPPKPGDRWRINFSRVERQGNINWTWQPQRIWDPVEKRFRGMVNMHLPDAWGYIEFAPPPDPSPQWPPQIVGELIQDNQTTPTTLLRYHRDPAWPVRLAALHIYYAQRRYAHLYEGQYARNLSALEEFFDKAIMEPFILTQNSDTLAVLMTTNPDGKSYIASVTDVDGIKACVNDKRLVTVEKI